MRPRRRLLAPLLLTLAACGAEPPIPADDVSLRVEIDSSRVVPGRAVPVRVVRTWSKALEPTPFAPRSLRPLALAPVASTRRENATHVEETLTFRGYALARAAVTVPPSTFAARPRDGGAARVASAPGKVLTVVPEIDAQAPGEPELPDAPPPEPTRWRILALGALGALLVLLLARRRRPPAAAPTPAPTADAATLAADARARCRAALETLLARPAATAAERAQRVLEIASVVRGALAASHGGSPARTASELAEAARTTDDRRLAAAARLVLAPAERVRFARLMPAATRLARIAAAARAALVEERVA